MNDPARIKVRHNLCAEGRFPPSEE
jgi:hypothetical protein